MTELERMLADAQRELDAGRLNDARQICFLALMQMIQDQGGQPMEAHPKHGEWKRIRDAAIAAQKASKR